MAFLVFLFVSPTKTSSVSFLSKPTWLFKASEPVLVYHVKCEFSPGNEFYPAMRLLSSYYSPYHPMHLPELSCQTTLQLETIFLNSYPQGFIFSSPSLVSFLTCSCFSITELVVVPVLSPSPIFIACHLTELLSRGIVLHILLFLDAIIKVFAQLSTLISFSHSEYTLCLLSHLNNFKYDGI